MLIICIYAALHLCGVLTPVMLHGSRLSWLRAACHSVLPVEIPTSPPVPALPQRGRHMGAGCQSPRERGDAPPVAPGGKRDRATRVILPLNLLSGPKPVLLITLFLF